MEINKKKENAKMKNVKSVNENIKMIFKMFECDKMQEKKSSFLFCFTDESEREKEEEKVEEKMF